jgi:protease-4
MKGSSKALLGILALVVILAIGVSVIVFGARIAAHHVPGHALLAIDISGSLPERTSESPLSQLFGPRPVSQQDLRQALTAAATDRRVRAVRVKIDDLGTSMATVQEVRDLLIKVGKAGKRTSAYLDTAGEFASGNLPYYLATSCQKIALNPVGDVNLIGLAARVPFIRGTLDKLGIEPDFPGIGAYKTARFLFTHKEMTPAEKDMMTWLVGSLSDQLVAGVAAGRGLDSERVRTLIDEAPQLGPQAVKEKLVDELTDWPAFREETLKLDGESLEEVSLRRYLRAERPFSRGTPIAVVVAEGTIARGESGYSPVPLFGGDIMGSETIARAFRQVRQSDAAAVIFRIDSPGGSAVASEIIRAEMARTAKQIPVVVSMSGVAASGGYWITCGARRVVADPASITASIGVFTGHFAMEEFWSDKLGVTWGRVDSAPNADIYDSLDPWTGPQQAKVQQFLDRIYDAFLDRVSQARKLPREEVDAMGGGRVFTAAQAKGKGLVDELGGFTAALAAARELAGLRADAPVALTYYPRLREWWERLIEEDVRARGGASELLSALQDGRLGIGGPVWLPPIEVR